MAIQSADDRLVCGDAGLIRLLTPPFDRTPNDPGYIKGYLPGIRENGGQYTHGVLWLVRAVAEMGRGTRAVERRLIPLHRSNDVVLGRRIAQPHGEDLAGATPAVGDEEHLRVITE